MTPSSPLATSPNSIFDILPFANFVALVPSIPAAQFVEFTDGRFAQVAGFRFTWDPTGTAQLLDDSGNVTTAGTRVREVVLDDGRTLVQNGVVVDGAPDVNIASIDFSARGGDQYPFRGAAFFALGVSYQQALANFIMTTLEGLVTATAYPEGGEGRIVALTPVQVTGRVDDSRPTSPIAAAACQFVALESTGLATTTADADGLFTLEVPPNTQGFVECTPPTLPNLVLQTFVSTMGLVDGVLSDQDVSPATAVISDLLQALLASDPTVDLDAMEAALLAELDAEEPQLSVLADTASALFEELSVFPLSSKSHWDAPVLINGRPVHVLLSHPTPPVFDGEEDRNGRRNHDEIRLWADYINGGARATYLIDDSGTAGGLTAGDSLVIMGDQNADPFDGDSVDDAILQLLNDPLIKAEIDNGFTPASAGAEEQAALQGGANTTHTGNPAFDTADFADNAPGNLRVDYVLPSADLSIVGSAVFWPVSTDPLFDLVGTFPFPSSDYRLLWVDVVVPR